MGERLSKGTRLHSQLTEEQLLVYGRLRVRLHLPLGLRHADCAHVR